MAAQKPPRSDPAMNLALAVVASSTAPLLLLDGDLTVVAASDSFCRSFRVGLGEIEGTEIFQLGDGEWNTKRLRSLLTATLSGNASVEAYEMDLDVKGAAPRRLVLNAQKLVYGARPSGFCSRWPMSPTRASLKRSRTTWFAKRSSCCRRCGTASPTACRSSPA